MKMDMQKYINDSMAARRKETLSQSDQLTLGELILKIEPIAANQKFRAENEEDIAEVVFDFEYLFPDGIDSWRGSYEELALSYSSRGRDSVGPMLVTDFLSMLKETVGKEFTGYKGGEYTMNKHTPIWVANCGNSGSTAVIEVVDNEYEVVLMTGYREF